MNDARSAYPDIRSSDRYREGSFLRFSFNVLRTCGRNILYALGVDFLFQFLLIMRSIRLCIVFATIDVFTLILNISWTAFSSCLLSSQLRLFHFISIFIFSSHQFEDGILSTYCLGLYSSCKISDPPITQLLTIKCNTFNY